MNRAIIIIALLALVALSGCISAGDSGGDSDGPNGETIETDGAEDVSRFIDTEANVVCWVFDDKIDGEYGHAGGLNCLPIPETALDGGSP
jgi:hypothetical protein